MWNSGLCLERRLMRSPKRMRCISVIISSYFGISLANPSLSAIKVPPPFLLFLFLFSFFPFFHAYSVTSVQSSENFRFIQDPKEVWT